MRFRPIASLSVVAAAALLLAGCAGSPDASQTPSDSATADTAGCQTPFTGDVPDGLEVSGDFSSAVTVTRPDGFAPDAIQRSTLIEGSGDEIAPGDLVKANYTVVDASTGEVLLDSLTSDPAGMDMIVNAQQIFGAAVSCVPVGSRTVSTFPAGTLGEGSPAYVLVADALAELPTRADGEEVAPVAGLPTVTFADDGAPTITVGSDPAPTETRVENLRRGDGDVVNPGDTVIVQYTGALYSDGTVFDSSWTKGAPTSFATTAVVPGFKKALEGQTVGSQVLAVVPPADGYGDQANDAIPANSTLVFVVDILGVQHAPAAG
ncbi:FKBP-type peptidyl-prolyl cis-trans isomerase [Microbacterium sp. PRF11]|uniref:FKBP-type peptidyl-prolyl cis-trans isomerase n=1 Tax=Microbacterium sp. PRF11 TaxID=2962593 RepID=UPI00288109A8|nr:FKBP-type peptidyl-prolyl cis-trans isomerase [Microbacterium sp. PRF11]MDT0115612.1 FKBP-type peptidyl-prolyl cis-trans isomerase [Microbacterium sp. PRF11]